MTSEKEQAFSFLNNIFVNHDFLQLSETEKSEIITQKKIHSNQLHWIFDKNSGNDFLAS